VSVRELARVAVGDEIDPRELVVEREAIRAYAYAGGDRNPLHLDDEVARSAGFDGVIAHGMFTMGHMAACVTRWVGDRSAVLRIDAQFRAPVFPGDRIVAGGRVRSKDVDTRTVVLDLWVSVDRNGEQEWPIKRGRAEVRLA
jgi:acyl dehydratase